MTTNKSTLLLILGLTLFVLACSLPTVQLHSSSNLTATPEPGTSKDGALVLSSKLSRGCEQKGPGAQPPKAGEPAIEFVLMDPEGNSYTLSELLAEMPVVLIFGSFT